MIAAHCPGCGVRLLAGMYGIAEAERDGIVVFPLTPDSDVETCDAVYMGFRCVAEPAPVCCPRCGSDVTEEPGSTPPLSCRGDDRDFMEIPVTDLELSVRARCLLHKAGVRVARDLLSLSAGDMRRAPGATAALVEEVCCFLAQRSLSLREDSR